MIYDKLITQVRGFCERPKWVITWHTHDFCYIIYNFIMTLLHFTIHLRGKELNNSFESRSQEFQSMVLLLVGIQKIVYSSLFASISSMKILSLSLSLSLSLTVAKHLFGIFFSFFKMKVEGFYFLFLDNIG